MLVLKDLDFPIQPLRQNPASVTLQISIVFFITNLYTAAGMGEKTVIPHYKFVSVKTALVQSLSRIPI